MSNRRTSLVASVLVVLALVAGCGNSTDQAASTSTDAGSSPAAATTSAAPSAPATTTAAPPVSSAAAPTTYGSDAAGLQLLCADIAADKATKLSEDPSIGLTSGQPVMAMTTALVDFGYLTEPSGTFTPTVTAGVRALQTAAAIGVDGIVGPVTWGVIETQQCKGD